MLCFTLCHTVTFIKKIYTFVKFESNVSFNKFNIGHDIILKLEDRSMYIVAQDSA